MAGKDAAAGFVNLLRRNIPPRDVLTTCFAEWKKSFAHADAGHPPRGSSGREALLDADNALRARPA